MSSTQCGAIQSTPRNIHSKWKQSGDVCTGSPAQRSSLGHLVGVQSSRKATQRAPPTYLGPSRDVAPRRTRPPLPPHSRPHRRRRGAYHGRTTSSPPSGSTPRRPQSLRCTPTGYACADGSSPPRQHPHRLAGCRMPPSPNQCPPPRWSHIAAETTCPARPLQPPGRSCPCRRHPFQAPGILELDGRHVRDHSGVQKSGILAQCMQLAWW